jgi:lipopolysaccharide export LptBFGC system permease protein LptF
MGLILLGLFSVYVLVDLSIHSVRFFASKADLPGLLLYYVHSFSIELNLFLALAFLLSILRVLFHVMRHSESISLSMAGISNQRLMRPMFLLASLLCLLSYANAEWVVPHALDSMAAFRDHHMKQKNQLKKEHVHAVSLSDGSEIVYFRYVASRLDRHLNALFDVYWVRSLQDIWHMKKLELTSPNLTGHFVDHFVREEGGAMVKSESYDIHPFSDLPLSSDQALQKFAPFEQRPLSTLFLQSFSNGADRQMIRTHLHHKLGTPLLPILITFALPPFLLSFSRQKRTYLIAACSLFALFAFITILDGMLILGENHVIWPSLATWGPWTLCMGAALRKFFSR